MGLTFHYKGQLKLANHLPYLIHEVEDICKILGWKSKVYEAEYPNHQFVTPVNDSNYGILIIPPSCEQVSLVFDSEGKICYPELKEIISKHPNDEIKVITINLNLDAENPEPIISESTEGFDPSEILYNISVKTNFSDNDSYIQLMELLRYLSSKYLDSFFLKDGSDYWDTKNPNNINEKTNKINFFMEHFNDMIQNESIKNPNEFLAHIKRLSQEIKKMEEEE